MSTEAAERKAQHVEGQQLRILIADDHPVVRVGLRHLLQAEEKFDVVGESVDGPDTIDMVRQLKPDVLLLDLAMPSSSGLEVLRELSREPGPTRAILVTAGIEKRELVEALQLGARGVIIKDSAMRDVSEAIRAVSDGQYWIGREPMANLVDALQGPAQPETRRPMFGLTPRELQVVATVVQGCTNRDIAQTLSISEDTVKRHLSNIFDKLGVSNRLELGLFAVHHNLVSATD